MGGDVAEKVIGCHPSASLELIDRRVPDRAIRSTARNQRTRMRTSGPSESTRDDGAGTRRGTHMRWSAGPAELLLRGGPGVGAVAISLQRKAQATCAQVDVYDPAGHTATRCPTREAGDVERDRRNHVARGAIGV